MVVLVGSWLIGAVSKSQMAREPPFYIKILLNIHLAEHSMTVAVSSRQVEREPLQFVVVLSSLQRIDDARLHDQLTENLDELWKVLEFSTRVLSVCDFPAVLETLLFEF